MTGKSASEMSSTKLGQLGEQELNSVSAGGSLRNPQGGNSGSSEIEVEKEVDRTSAALVQACT